MPTRRAVLAAVAAAPFVSPGSSLAQSRGGVINVATIGEPPTLDPMVSTTDLVGIIAQHVFETLFTFDPTWQVIPLLAAAMPALSQNGTVYDIALREGVQFHDGTTMTAKDVVASLKRWMDVASRGRSAAANITSVEATSPTAVRLTLKTAYAPLLALLAFNNSAAIILPAAKQDNPMKEIVGTGPYRLKERRPDQYIQLVRFDGYTSRPGEPDGYGGARKAILDEIRFVPVPDANTRVESALAGQYDFTGNLPVESLARIKGQKAATPVLLKPFGWPSLNFNTRQGLSAKLPFRQAVRAALSMEDMLAAAFGSTDFYTAEGALYPPGFIWTTQAGVAGTYNLADPGTAGALLKAAGYDGTPFRILTSQQYEFHYKIAQVAAEYLKAAAIKVDMQVVDWATLTQRRADPALWDMYVSDSPFLPEPALIGQLDSSGPVGWNSPARAKALDAFNGEQDPKKRIALWADVQSAIMTEVPYIKVGDYNALAAQSPRLRGVPPAPWPYFWNASWADGTMGRYILHRFVGMLVVLFVVVTISFVITRIAPGDPASVMLGPNATAQDIDALQARMGLDRPLAVQYATFLAGILHGDLGWSIFLNRPVTQALAERAEPTFFLTLFAILIATALALPVGIYAAYRRGSMFDQLATALAMLAASVPGFWLGLLLIQLLAVRLGWFPASGYGGPGDSFLSRMSHLVLPAVALGLVSSSLILRFTRASMLDVLSDDYVRTARSKGMNEVRVVMRHAFRNALIPVLTVLGLTAALLVSGAVVTETVFGLPGMGNLVVSSVLRRDYPVIQGALLVIAALYVLFNFAIDMLYLAVDPRVRY